MRYLKLTNCRFPPSHFLNLTKLHLENCYQINNIQFGQHSRLEELQLSSNNLSEVPPQIFQLRNLRYLGLGQNQIKCAIVSLSTNSLEVLDLSSNGIEEFHLSFPEGEIKLKQLDLGYNQLREISMDSIGHAENFGSFWELDLIGNPLSKDEIAKLIPQLPQSTHCLWANRFGSFVEGESGYLNYLSEEFILS